MATSRKDKKQRNVSHLLHRPGQIIGRAKSRYTLKRRGTIGFEIENVAGFDITSPRIPEYTMNLYRDVRILKKALGNTPYKRSLEIGCGYGRITPWIAEHSREHHAVEPEPKLLKVATELYPSVKFRKGIVQKLPYPDNYFDLIVVFSVLHHLPPDKFSEAARDMKRVAKRTATIFLHERVVGKEGDAQRSWIHDYGKAFSPWKLVSIFDRNVTSLGKDPFNDMKAMLLKRSS
jgi:SAM-dependent methyltransferase